MMRRFTLTSLAAGLVLSTVALPAAAQDPGDTSAGVDVACPGGAPDAGFTDVPAANVHSDAIDCGVALGVILGLDDTSYGPAQQVTRGQLASLIARALDAWDVELPPVAGAPTFPDIGAPHGDNIRRLAAAEVLAGRNDGTFGTSAPVTRDQLASIYVRTLEYIYETDIEPDERGHFSDVVDGVHAANIDAAFELGLVNGKTDGSFDPRGTTRRDQAATVVINFLAFLLEGEVDVTLVATNDFHGRLEAPSYELTPEGSDEPVDVGGAAYLASHIEAVREDNPNTLWVDAGDLVGATPVLSNVFLDEPTVEFANLLGLDVQTAGNHEFDRGQDELLRRLEGGCHADGCFDDDNPYAGQDFMTLAANVVHADSGETLTEPYEVIDVAGVEIGFLGVVTGATPTVVHPEGIEGLEFLPEADTINEWVPVMEDEGVDAVVVLLHEGGRQDGTYNECEDFRGAAANIVDDVEVDVDVMITGHTHQSYVCDLEDGPLVTSSNEYGTMYSRIELSIVPGAGVVSRSATNNLVTRDVTPHAATESLIERYQEMAGPMLEEVVGTSEVEIPRTTRSAESAQGNLATDALRDQFGTDFAFQNSGGLRAPLTVLDPEDGLYPIRRRDVLDVWPFGNTVVLAEVDGPTLEAYLAHGIEAIGAGSFIQVSGLRIEYELTGDTVTRGADEWPEARIVAVEYWGHPEHADGTAVDLSASATHTVATNDFMAGGGDGYPNINDDVYALEGALEIVVEQYLLENSPVAPEVEGRIVEVGGS